jgi:transcriptional regulator with XRE-family HTH domain
LANVDLRIGRQIEQRRAELGWSREQLAKHLNIRVSEVFDYENGFLRPNGTMLIKIALTLNRPPSYFFQGSKELPSC